jgi:formate hydrogenlyase subunit 4
VTIAIWILQALFIPLFSPLVIGIIKKIKAAFQHRQGAGIFQPYRDLLKLFRKSEVLAEDSSWVFRFAPYVVFATTVVAGASVPVFTTLHPSLWIGDLLLFVYILALGTFFLALSGMDAGSAFGGFGSSREMTVSAIAEGSLLFSLLVPAFHGRTTDLFALAGQSLPASPTVEVAYALAFVGFMIALLAESGRFPFDNPATHLELTMIHEAMILENSGPGLALMEWASANKLLIFLTLGANLFFPWVLSPAAAMADMGLPLLFYGAKVLVLASAIGVLESMIAKYRFFRLPDVLLTSIIMSAIAIGLSV